MRFEVTVEITEHHRGLHPVDDTEKFQTYKLAKGKPLTTREITREIWDLANAQTVRTVETWRDWICVEFEADWQDNVQRTFILKPEKPLSARQVRRYRSLMEARLEA